MNPASPFPDLRGLDPTTYAAAVVELIEAAFEHHEGAAAHAREALEWRFGRTVTEELAGPVLEALLGRSPDDLAPGAHELFFSRVVALSGPVTRALKTVPELDGPLAFHSSEESPSPRAAWYPATGGCGRWIQDLEQRHLAGVDRRLGQSIDAVLESGGRAVAVVLAGGERVELDRIVWTLPPALLLKGLGRPTPEGATAPQFVRTELRHLILDRPFETDLHYVTCFDPHLDLFRVTLYPQLRGHPGQAPHACTVELMRPPGHTPVEPDDDEVVRRLARLGVVTEGTQARWSGSTSIPVGFPVPTVAHRRDSLRLAEAASDGVANLEVVGRATGRAFFMADVLRQCFEALRD